MIASRNAGTRKPKPRGAANLPDWILVADAGSARLFSRGPAEDWTLLQELDRPEAHLIGNELRAIEPGREQSPRAGHRLGIEKTTVADTEEERFSRHLAELLHAGLDQHAYHQLELVAPPSFLGQITAALDPQVALHVARRVAKDYTRTSLRELQQLLEIARA